MKYVPLVRVFAIASAFAIVHGAQQTPEVRIMTPTAETIVSGPTRLEASVWPAGPSVVESVTFFVNGRAVCTVQRPPYGCSWDPGAVIREYHVRVLVALPDGNTVAANVRTKNIGHAERSRVDAVLVPVIVTDDGQFVRGLKKQDFEVFEDEVPQTLQSVVSEDTALDLVLAIDISGSMDSALPEVKTAVKQLLRKLRPGDAATLIGFNDSPFIVAEREKDQQTREAAVDLLASWGGTALYDATVRALDLVGREWGRKGVVLFSDGDDRNSLTRRETAMAKVQASDAMLYSIGFGMGATLPTLRTSLEDYARSTGGRSFFPRKPEELDQVFDDIVGELANQYVLSYTSTNVAEESRYREIKVRVRKGKYDVRARRGYRPQGTHRASNDGPELWRPFQH